MSTDVETAYVLSMEETARERLEDAIVALRVSEAHWAALDARLRRERAPLPRHT